MSQKSPTGFVTSLIAEIAIISAVVSLLPRVPLGRAAPVPADVADERPSLLPQFNRVPRPEPLPPPDGNWRTAVERPVEPAAPLPLDLPPADPAYVEKKLDQAGQQLLEGVSHYLSRQARQLMQPPASPDPPQASPEPPAYRQWPH
ncbi:MAG: hypothetical protein L0211_03015 [Planctomycetaceae bacterium]|nr:hypothetical protein [Planctomycetaceae bacterium]